jgi:phosphatidylglycerol lysyltransferase
LYHSRAEREAVLAILDKNSTTSEDFFMLWPADKAYLLSAGGKGCIAYKVTGNVALAVGDPVAEKDEVKNLVTKFLELCYVNDWLPAFIHSQKQNLSLFKSLGFEIQKIGEEAIVDVRNFCETVASDKYFRHINNRFGKNGYSFELLEPPHSSELVERLGKISDDWLKLPGRIERGFMLGYFDKHYMQMCNIAVVKDENGEIQAFLNQVPSPRAHEANYDLLRSAEGSMGNINDFLMSNFIKYLAGQDFRTLNMGLSPLAGLDAVSAEDKSVVTSLLNLVYSKADHFYSFAGLTRFKNKYHPTWQPRYIVYRGGLAGFGRTMRALLKAMSR